LDFFEEVTDYSEVCFLALNNHSKRIATGDAHVSETRATVVYSHLAAKKGSGSYSLSDLRTATLRLSSTATALCGKDFDSSRAEASCRVAPDPVFLFCAWYEPIAGVALAFAATGFRAAISQESVPSK